jgi:hypothetical protein
VNPVLALAATSNFSLGELNATDIENLFSGLEALDIRQETLGIVELNGSMTYQDSEEV